MIRNSTIPTRIGSSPNASRYDAGGRSMTSSACRSWHSNSRKKSKLPADVSSPSLSAQSRAYAAWRWSTNSCSPPARDGDCSTARPCCRRSSPESNSPTESNPNKPPPDDFLHPQHLTIPRLLHRCSKAACALVVSLCAAVSTTDQRVVTNTACPHAGADLPDSVAAIQRHIRRNPASVTGN
jgi:hypothetical protein